MARRYDHSPEQIRRMALDATGEIIAQEGLRALSTRKVANHIGYTVGTLYNHFRNLDDLILILNGETLDSLHETLKAIPRTGDPAADLKKLAETYLRFTWEHLHVWNTIFEHSLPADIEVPEWYQKKLVRLLEIIEIALSPLSEAMPPAERAKHARILWSAVHGLCSLANSGKLGNIADSAAEDLSHDLIDTYLVGISKD
ncbi:MAG: TetR/AcrR family transcriptional regulator [Magnetospiraceae bacterium]